MQIVEISPARCERLAGPVLVAFFVVAAGLSPVDGSWRWILAAGVLLLGVLSLWRYWSMRPDAIELTSSGTLVFRYGVRRRATIVSVLPGIVSERLLVFRYRLENGTRGNLVISAMALSRDDHWALRRAVLAVAVTPKPSDQRRLGR